MGRRRRKTTCYAPHHSDTLRATVVMSSSPTFEVGRYFMDEFEVKRLTASARQKMAQIDQLFEAAESGQNVTYGECLNLIDELKAIWQQLGAAETNPELIGRLDKMRDSILRMANEKN
jgi:hypothetical protein